MSDPLDTQKLNSQDCSESILVDMSPFTFDEAYPCMMPAVQNIDLIVEPVLSEEQSVASIHCQSVVSVARSSDQLMQPPQ